MTFRTLELRIEVQALTGAVLAGLNRFMIVLDKQCNGAIPSMGVIITPAAMWGGRNLDYRKRFKIIMDKVRYSSTLANDPSRIYIHQYIKFRRPIITDYNGNVNGDVTDIATNSLLFVAFGDNAANAPSLNKFWYRLRYTDV